MIIIYENFKASFIVLYRKIYLNKFLSTFIYLFYQIYRFREIFNLIRHNNYFEIIIILGTAL